MASQNKPFWTKANFWTGSKNYVQFSKRIALAVTIFWMVYRIINFVVILIRPEVAETLEGLVEGVDKAMIANMGWYTGNSSVEKAVMAFSGDNKKDKKSKDEDSEEDEEDEIDNG